MFMRPVALSCLVVVFRHIHLVTAGPFPSRHPVDLLRPQYASKTYGCLEGAARFGDGLRRGCICTICRNDSQAQALSRG